MKNTAIATSFLTLIFSQLAMAEMNTKECKESIAQAEANTSNAQDLQTLNILAEDIADYDSQSALIPTLSGADKAQAEQAQHDTWQSILYGYGKIENFDPKDAAAIGDACSIPI